MSLPNDICELDGRQKTYRALIIACFSITGMFVTTRGWVRLRLQAQFTVDDYLLVVALAAYAIQTSFSILAIDYGGIGHRATSELPHAAYIAGVKWIILTQSTYPLVLMFAKLSIALLQLRIMGLSTPYVLRRTHYASMVLCVLVSVFGFFTAFIQCDPRNTPYPDLSAGGAGGILIPVVTCRSPSTMLVANYVYAALSIVLDWYYALAMVPAVWALQNVSPVVRLSVILILGTGVLASVATVVRLVYLVDVAGSLDVLPVVLWSTIEVCTGTSAACMATFRPLLKRIVAPFSSRATSSVSKEKRSSRASSGQTDSSGEGKTHPVHFPALGAVVYWYAIARSRASSPVFSDALGIGACRFDVDSDTPTKRRRRPGQMRTVRILQVEDRRQLFPALGDGDVARAALSGPDARLLVGLSLQLQRLVRDPLQTCVPSRARLAAAPPPPPHQDPARQRFQCVRQADDDGSEREGREKAEHGKVGMLGAWDHL
ncbi:uncharacterized protein BKCO1_700002 [Diplodia corticola]|uniref:Integral membrane protein n=1 Tax=Diplodia corticola TaxID=236234 RepID=A0A1J9QPC1_9PEZI|nr:uncharacterized protein BKCO1_700002 [Diplodia corticola]OJD29898.1 integral membrane protein [Diplodia corticola]